MLGVGVQFRIVEQRLGEDQALGAMVRLATLREAPRLRTLPLSAIVEIVEVIEFRLRQALPDRDIAVLGEKVVDASESRPLVGDEPCVD